MYCFSQNTYPKIVQDSLIAITPQQLKLTNCIFLEHQKLRFELIELNKKIEYQGETVNYLETSLDLKNTIIANQDKIQEELIKEKDKEIKKYKRVGAITGIIALLFIIL